MEQNCGYFNICKIGTHEFKNVSIQCPLFLIIYEISLFMFNYCGSKIKTTMSRSLSWFQQTSFVVLLVSSVTMLRDMILYCTNYSSNQILTIDNQQCCHQGIVVNYLEKNPLFCIMMFTKTLDEFWQAGIQANPST